MFLLRWPSRFPLCCLFADEPELIVPRPIRVPDNHQPSRSKKPGPPPLLWMVLLAVVAGGLLFLKLAEVGEEGGGDRITAVDIGQMPPLPEQKPEEHGEPIPPSDVEPRDETTEAPVEADGPREVVQESGAAEEPGEIVASLEGQVPRLQGEDPAATLEVKNKAHESLKLFLIKKQALEDKGVAEWGGELYQAIRANADAADRFMLSTSYVEAEKGYREAIAGCEELAARAPAALHQLLAEGADAFAATNGAVAVRKFEAATKLDPSNQVAATLLSRSHTLDQVGALLRSASQHELDQTWSLALIDYQEAVDLDPKIEAAVQGLDRVTQAMKEERFQALMSEGLLALHRGELDRAEKALNKAAILKPGSDELENALFQVAEARRVLRIRTLQVEADDAERTGDWKNAYQLYKDVLAVDTHIQAAREGKDRNARRIKLHKQMAYYQDNPTMLRSEQGRKNATLILHEAKELGGQVMAWEQSVASLEQQLTEASTPVAVVIESDGATQVDVYRVGKLGSFKRHTVSLLPGTYTVVGHRKGYKDQRKKVTVEPGEKVEISVVCKEGI